MQVNINAYIYVHVEFRHDCLTLITSSCQSIAIYHVKYPV